MSDPPGISLVLSDVDGTLVNEEKVLTERARGAVQRLHEAGIRFAITSGRPPRGMEMLFEPLALDTPVAAFNGGVFAMPDLTIVEQKTLPSDVAAEAVAVIRAHGLDPWIYAANDWLIANPDAPHVRREARTVQFEPTVVADPSGSLDGAVKIVGVSDDLDAVRRCETAAREALGSRASASRSQPYYLDVTHRDANKGAVVEHLSRTLGVARERIATIGDGPNDVLMFRKSKLAIAMGNASDAVKAAAGVTAASYTEEGFAKAIERFILGDGSAAG